MCVASDHFSKNVQNVSIFHYKIGLNFTDFGRNIRQLPCVSRRSGETGVCMFAYSCAKANGTHLGTCIDRFYFGSCCKMQEGSDFDVNEPDNYLNNVDNNDVVGPLATTNVKVGAQQSTSTTDRYGGAGSISSSTSSVGSSTIRPYSQSTLTSFPSTSSSYKPTTQFVVSSSSSSSPTPTTSSTSRYTEASSVSSGSTRPQPTHQYVSSSSSSSSSSTPSSMSSSYSATATATVGQSTKPAAPSATFSTVKPSVKPSSSFKPPTTGQKPKPQTAKPTVQFNVPSSSTTSPNGALLPHTTGHDTIVKTPTTATAATSTYATVTSLRPIGSNVTTMFSTTKPVIKPSSSATQKPTTPTSTTFAPTASTQKVRPQTTKPTAKPKPSTAKPVSTSPPSTVEPPVTGSYSIRSTVENVTEIIGNLTASTAAMNAQSHTPSYSSSSTVTSTSPTLVTWTTLDKVPAMPSENTKPSSSKSVTCTYLI